MRIGGRFPRTEIWLPHIPLSSVASIKYWNDATPSAETTVATTVYESDTDSEPGRIRLQEDEDWPTDVRSHPESIEIEYISGYGDREFVPEVHKRNVLTMVAELYEHRGDKHGLGYNLTQSDFVQRLLQTQKRIFA